MIELRPYQSTAVQALQSPRAVTHHGHRLAAVSMGSPTGHVCRLSSRSANTRKGETCAVGFFFHAMPICKKCGCDKPADGFYIRKESGRPRKECKSCINDATGKWARENLGKRRAIALKYAKANYPKIYANKARYRAADPERMRRWSIENPERMQAARARWDAANKHRKTEHAAARRARIRQALPSWADRDAMAAIYQQARQMSQATGEPWEVDHIVPIAGKNVCGLHVEHNLRVLRMPENRAKGRKHG